MLMQHKKVMGEDVGVERYNCNAQGMAMNEV